MLTYEQALERLVSAIPSPRLTSAPLDQALGLVLAKPIVAPLDLPRFDNSAVDGYALNVSDTSQVSDTSTLRVIGQSEAGRPFSGVVREGEAIRIFTGAQVPQGANAVVMQEDVGRSDHTIRAHREVRVGQHIRRQGEDLRQGAEALPAGTRLRPQELGLLASLGYRRVSVYQPPTAAILSTGDELRLPGSRLKSGQLYESNSVVLQGLVRRLGARPIRLGCVRDTLGAAVRAIRRSLTADLLLISGGVSVGEKDFVRQAAMRCGVQSLLWQVDIKPGMPLFVGRRRRTLVFGLPGNPVSVFVTFEEFVKPVIARLMGRPWHDGYVTPATLANDVTVSPTRRTHFVRVRCVRQESHLSVEPVHPAPWGGVQAEGWIRLDATQGPWRAGTQVLVKTA
ncbi:MAG: molybdopterin molybdotransferase MoeA [Candidatus Omnitrophica bacterium]|nr:molybdopterin molybdotransferase MoeA [Candidatus Omnitrophota bacterium]